VQALEQIMRSKALWLHEHVETLSPYSCDCVLNECVSMPQDQIGLDGLKFARPASRIQPIDESDYSDSTNPTTRRTLNGIH
jgi:hypothetical protein